MVGCCCFGLCFVEASLPKLRSAIFRVVWFGRQPPACIGAVLSLLGGPQGCDPAFCVVWFRFLMIRKYLACHLEEVGGIYRMLPLRGALVWPVHHLIKSATELGFRWDSCVLGWMRPGLPWLGLFSIFGLRCTMPGEVTSLPISAPAGGFRGGPLLDVHGALQLLDSGHVRERQRRCSEVCWWVVSGVASSLGRFGASMSLVVFVEVLMEMAIFFGTALVFPSLSNKKILSFTISWRWISLDGLGVCFGLVGCLFFLG